jgi:hypothetical protein
MREVGSLIQETGSIQNPQIILMWDTSDHLAAIGVTSAIANVAWRGVRISVVHRPQTSREGRGAPRSVRAGPTAKAKPVGFLHHKLGGGSK